jgi:predicted lipid-binding transport protein (Tim44 family)
LFGGLAAGFLGAGLFGMLFGHGFFGGMAGFASIIGLLLQVALVVIVAKLLFAWWQRRNMPAYAAAQPAAGHGFAGLGGMLGSSTPAGSPLSRRTTMRSSNCSAIFSRLTRLRISPLCAPR